MGIMRKRKNAKQARGAQRKKLVNGRGLKAVHITTKARENAYVVRSGSYMWNGCEQRERKCWLKDPSLNLCQRSDCHRKEVRYALDMVLKHSQKGR